jgi:hypothetical protein
MSRPLFDYHSCDTGIIRKRCSGRPKKEWNPNAWFFRIAGLGEQAQAGGGLLSERFIAEDRRRMASTGFGSVI